MFAVRVKEIKNGRKITYTLPPNVYIVIVKKHRT